MSGRVRCYRFKGAVSPEELKQSLRKSFPDLVVQTTDHVVASNETFVQMIGEQTLQAKKDANLLAKKPELDLLMRLGGTTQIARAIRDGGVKKGRDFLLIVIGDEADIRELEAKEAAEWERLEGRPLTTDDLQRIEEAALLNAERA